MDVVETTKKALAYVNSFLGPFAKVVRHVRRLGMNSEFSF